ncbi:mitochondrial carrier [Ceraceosorus guamensis]|uniref:Mitochondrial glycine transporter n=1 Tax=Ceraceosorus guamensis TaxID=1522189 RepID=A0A316VNM0_9BASI|nr:mitochondrial carrier [Ceraceosorus guamensis]PWN39229.1 mitochondrial carrier [Ceraceosorus guamensis]
MWSSINVGSCSAQMLSYCDSTPVATLTSARSSSTSSHATLNAPSSSSSVSSTRSEAKVTSKASIPPYATLISGGASGLASCLLLQPLDLLKTRMQQSPRLRSADDGNGTRGRDWSATGRTRRLVGVARNVVNEEGVKGLWRGTGPTVVRNVPGVALYFYSVTELRRFLSNANVPILSVAPQITSSTGKGKGKESTMASLSAIGNLTTGAAARTAIGFVLCPVTVVKARFESSNFAPTAYKSISSALVHIYKTDGVRGLFQGFTATALRDAPYAGLYMACYESCKHWLGSVSDRGSGSTRVVMASGLIAGTTATLLTHPFDILKTRLQTTPRSAISVKANASAVALGTNTASQRSASTTLISLTREMLSKEGAGAFLDGLGLRCARKAASSAIGWGIFEYGRNAWLRLRHA